MQVQVRKCTCAGARVQVEVCNYARTCARGGPRVHVRVEVRV